MVTRQPRERSSEGITESLVISKKIMDRHRASILEKLEMRNRVELTRYAIKRGLVEPLATGVRSVM